MPTASSFTLGLVQLRCDADPANNLERALAAVRRSANNGAEIVCLGDLFAAPSFWQQRDPDNFNLAEPIPGPTCERLAEAASASDIALAATLFERSAAGVYYATAVVFDANGSLVGVYRRAHLADEPLAGEKYYFAPAEAGPAVFDTRFGRVGVLPGWDQWFPEAARLRVLHGAEVLLCPAAFGGEPDEKEDAVARREAWELTLRAHAVAGGVFVAAVNRVGHEGPADSGVNFWGSSLVSDPSGRLLGQATEDREEVLVVPCDRARLEEVRRQLPFLRDRRPDTYAELTRRWLG
jgi:N-carbamoylputrescine amidase